MKPILLMLATFAALSVVFTAPAAATIPVYHLTVTVTVDGHSFATQVGVPNPKGLSVINVPVPSALLTDISNAFGTTTLVFPGSATGHFTLLGVPFTVAISDLTDSFTLQFVQAK